MDERFDNQARGLAAALFIVFLLVAARLWQLQLLDGATYSRLASENAARTIPMVAPRGIIYDRYGKVIVSNRAILSAYFLPKAVEDEMVEPLLARLSPVLGSSKDELMLKVVARSRFPCNSPMRSCALQRVIIRI